MFSVRKVGGYVLVMPCILFFPSTTHKVTSVTCVIKVFAFHILCSEFLLGELCCLQFGELGTRGTPEQGRVTAFPITIEQTEPHSPSLLSKQNLVLWCLQEFCFTAAPGRSQRARWAVGAFVCRSFRDCKHSLCVFLINVVLALLQLWQDQF